MNSKQGDGTGLYFPDREDFDTIEEYDESVKMYWDAIDAYHDMAIELHDKVMKGKSFVRDRDEKRVNRER